MPKKTLTSTISSKGQTTLPAAVRRLLRVASGDSLLYELEKEAVRIRKATSLDITWAKAVGSTLTEWNGPDDDDL
jgi:AbrB family looped-hinge helix DNA binding protein